MIREKTELSEYVIDLNGPEGNAYCLMGHARKLSRALNLNTNDILTEMMSGDYENLVEVFDKHFGDYVILER